MAKKGGKKTRKGHKSLRPYPRLSRPVNGPQRACDGLRRPSASRFRLFLPVFCVKRSTCAGDVLREQHSTAREAPLGAKRGRGDVPKCDSTKGASGVCLSSQNTLPLNTPGVSPLSRQRTKFSLPHAPKGALKCDAKCEARSKHGLGDSGEGATKGAPSSPEASRARQPGRTPTGGVPVLPKEVPRIKARKDTAGNRVKTH